MSYITKMKSKQIWIVQMTQLGLPENCLAGVTLTLLPQERIKQHFMQLLFYCSPKN